MNFRENGASTFVMRAPSPLLSHLRNASRAALIPLVLLAIAMLTTACAGGTPPAAGVPAAIPVIAAVTPMASPANTYKVIGDNFADGLTVQVSQNGMLLESLSGTQISNLAVTSFAMEIGPLPSGTYGLQVVSADQISPALFPFTVAANR